MVSLELLVTRRLDRLENMIRFLVADHVSSVVRIMLNTQVATIPVRPVVVTIPSVRIVVATIFPMICFSSALWTFQVSQCPEQLLSAAHGGLAVR